MLMRFFKSNLAFLFLYPLLFSLLFSCDKGRIYENNVKIDSSNWAATDSLVFTFEIPQGGEDAIYNLLYNVRYSIQYPYYNLYLKHSLCDSNGNVLNEQLMNMNLFDPKTGKPLGTGMGDVFDREILFLPNFKFPHTGKYTLKAKNYMRDKPLKGIETLGLRVEKVEK